MTAKKKSTAKIFILDTNVILHDHKCLDNFEDNDLILPITVLEELDKFKKGSDQINFQAREFVRIMDKLAGEQLFSEGVPLGKDKGRLFIATGKPFPQRYGRIVLRKNTGSPHSGHCAFHSRKI
jgi:PhoH-like ATPase